MSSEKKVYFNGVNAVTGTYGRPEMTREDFYAFVRGQSTPIAPPEQLKPKGVRGIPESDHKNLSQTGWGIIFAAQPATKSPTVDDIEAALGKLIEHRRRMSGGFCIVYKGEAGYKYGDLKDTFLRDHGVGAGSAASKRGLPYYLLLIGGPDDISLDFQYSFDVQYSIGRLNFKNAGEYEKYAESVVTTETKGNPRGRTLHFFATNHDPATQYSHDNLATPLYDRLSQKFGGQWDIRSTLGKAANSRPPLERILGGSETPALLFTATHGIERPADDGRRENDQGALLCQWNGFSIDRDGYFAADNLTGDVTGLIGIHFACFSGGLEFDRDGTRMKPPFLAALPQKMLLNGALAVLAHVDTTLSYSFAWPGFEKAQDSPYDDLFNSLLEGYPLGHALDAFGLRQGVLASELLEMWNKNDDQIDRDLLASLWTAYHDGRTFLILGDPAARAFMPDEPDPIEDYHRPTVTESPGLGGNITLPSERPQLPPVAEGATAGVYDYGAAEVGAAIRDFAQKLAESVKQLANDISTVEIKTYVAASDSLDENDPSKSTNLKLQTSIKLDGDTDLRLPSSGIDPAIWKLHLEMVASAQKHRLETIDLLLTIMREILS